MNGSGTRRWTNVGDGVRQDQESAAAEPLNGAVPRVTRLDER